MKKSSMYYPEIEEFRRLAKEGNTIPVYKEMLADMDTPVSAYLKIRKGNSFLLESLANDEKWARYSFIGYSPRKIIHSYGNSVHIKEEGRGEVVIEADDPLSVLKGEMSGYRHVRCGDLPPFYGGLVGYIGYENVKYFERVPDREKPGLLVPDMYFVLADTILIFDHQKLSIKVVVNTFLDGIDPDTAYGDAIRRIEETIEAMERCEIMYKKINSIKSAEMDIEIESSYNSKEEFMSAVDRSKEYIKAGDIFQVVLSQRLSARCKADPFNIYRALRLINPSPYMFYFDFDGFNIIGASPEILVRLRGDKVILRPIAGTRKRGADEAADLALERELLNDPKELAEHIMLVDLGRNDLGRISKIGSVHMKKMMFIERYSHVMHIVSDIEGELRDGLNGFDVLAACFPAGTVTGAPKVRAMEIIDELEHVRRGPYAGAVGYFGFSGDMDTCITIRTMVVKDEKIYFQAGAGIVADSIPENEYDETINKAMAAMRALAMAEERME